MSSDASSTVAAVPAGDSAGSPVPACPGPARARWPTRPSRPSRTARALVDRVTSGQVSAVVLLDAFDEAIAALGDVGATGST